jgi:AcrR family transcriptional regulator
MPKIVDHEAYIAELVEGAALLFSERGYGSVTMRQLAVGLKVSTGTLYHYFSSKQALFEASVRHVIEKDARQAREAFADISSGTGLGVEDLLGFLLANEEQQMRQFSVILDYWRLHPEDRTRLAPTLREAHDTYASLAARLLGSEDHGLGELVVSALFNIIEMRWLHGPEFDHCPQLRLLERLVAVCLRDESDGRTSAG